MDARMTVLMATTALAAAATCSGRSALTSSDGAARGTADSETDVPGSGGMIAGGGEMSSGGTIASGGIIGNGGSRASGGAGGGGAGGTTACLGPSPLGAGVGGGACEGAIRCIDVKSATLGYETCNWLLTAGRASVFETLRACFAANADFCSSQPASVEACTSSIFAQACPGPGATVDGVTINCRRLAGVCPAISEKDCHLLTDVLNDRSYQAAFECYLRQNALPTDCGATLRKCVGAPLGGSGGATTSPGSGGTGGTGGTTAGNDAATSSTCPDLAGSWNVYVSCLGPGAFFSGSIVAAMTQSGCKVTFTQTDAQTGRHWVATGTVEGNGRGSLRGAFGFTDSSMCDLEAQGDGWTGRCGSATQACQLEATKQPG